MRKREETQVGLDLESREEKNIRHIRGTVLRCPREAGERELEKDPLELAQRRPL